jgi:5'(3')-deoxyribonucleotidase
MHPTLRKRIALDMDEVMADTLTAWLERYNQDFGTRITKADLHGKKIYDLVGPGRAAAARFPNFVQRDTCLRRRVIFLTRFVVIFSRAIWTAPCR